MIYQIQQKEQARSLFGGESLKVDKHVSKIS